MSKDHSSFEKNILSLFGSEKSSSRSKRGIMYLLSRRYSYATIMQQTKILGIYTSKDYIMSCLEELVKVATKHKVKPVYFKGTNYSVAIIRETDINPITKEIFSKGVNKANFAGFVQELGIEDLWYSFLNDKRASFPEEALEILVANKHIRQDVELLTLRGVSIPRVRDIIVLKYQKDELFKSEGIDALLLLCTKFYSEESSIEKRIHYLGLEAAELEGMYVTEKCLERKSDIAERLRELESLKKDLLTLAAILNTPESVDYSKLVVTMSSNLISILYEKLEETLRSCGMKDALAGVSAYSTLVDTLMKASDKYEEMAKTVSDTAEEASIASGIVFADEDVVFPELTHEFEVLAANLGKDEEEKTYLFEEETEKDE